jgi:hypothetical protein
MSVRVDKKKILVQGLTDRAGEDLHEAAHMIIAAVG